MYTNGCGLPLPLLSKGCSWDDTGSWRLNCHANSEMAQLQGWTPSYRQTTKQDHWESSQNWLTRALENGETLFSRSVLVFCRDWYFKSGGWLIQWVHTGEWELIKICGWQGLMNNKDIAALECDLHYLVHHLYTLWPQIVSKKYKPHL